MTGTKILSVENGAVRLCADEVGTCSIGLKTDKDYEWKYISKELYDLLIKELSEQNGNK